MKRRHTIKFSIYFVIAIVSSLFAGMDDFQWLLVGYGLGILLGEIFFYRLTKRVPDANENKP